MITERCTLVFKDHVTLDWFNDLFHQCFVMHFKSYSWILPYEQELTSKLPPLQYIFFLSNHNSTYYHLSISMFHLLWVELYTLSSDKMQLSLCFGAILYIMQCLRGLCTSTPYNNWNMFYDYNTVSVFTYKYLFYKKMVPRCWKRGVFLML